MIYTRNKRFKCDLDIEELKKNHKSKSTTKIRQVKSEPAWTTFQSNYYA